jgi:hypothetical protein
MISCFSYLAFVNNFFKKIFGIYLIFEDIIVIHL